MGKKRHHISSTQKELKKQKRKAKQEQRMLQKKTEQKTQVEASPETDQVKLELNSLLTYGDYSVYYIVSDKKIGYLGVFLNGRFNYSIFEDNLNESQILIFIKNFLRSNLGLVPILNPRLYSKEQNGHN